MKRKIVVILCFLLLTPVYAGAFQNEPDNFRGIKWGTNISQLPEMYGCTEHELISTCLRKGDEMQIGIACVKGIGYIFYQDKLCGVQIHCEDASNFKELKKAVFSEYGGGWQENESIGRYIWLGNDVMITLVKDLDGGKLYYYYMPLVSIYRKELDERAKK